MAYITSADLEGHISEQVLIQLTDDQKTGTVNADIVTAAIADAGAEIDGYVATRYAVPVSPVLALIIKLARDITIKNLYSRRLRVPDDVRKNYESAISMLKDIAKGTLTLGVDPAPAEASKASGGEAIGPERVFDRDKLGSF